MEDLKLISDYTNNIRTYSVHGSLGLIPELAEHFGINVLLGIWIGPDAEQNNVEIERCIEIANRSSNIRAVVIGNESIFRNDISIEQLIKHIQYVKSKTRLPVSCSEQWHIWAQYPELASHVDIISAHILPFWENIPRPHLHQSLTHRLELLKESFPSTPVILSEVGWPSGGTRINKIKANSTQQKTYLQKLIRELKHSHDSYYIIEAFDQTWKTEEGAVGTQWGIMTADRLPKFSFNTASSRDSIISQIKNTFIDSSFIRAHLKAALVLTGVIYSFLILGTGILSNPQYSVLSAVTTSFLVLLSTSISLFTEIHEWCEAAWSVNSRRMFLPVLSRDVERPTVSIHVPCCSEPPGMVIQTLNALKTLNYEKYEVLVIDNNTHDPALWKPVRDHCLALGQSFRFFHIEDLEGFKAGALNFALQHTHKDVEIIGVIDSDYCVDSRWLQMMTPHFSSASVALVQCPQDYSDRFESFFKSMCYSEYRGFFDIGMVIRNDHNAIIQHGTMTLVRRTVLDDLGWANWCICEDAELGLRIMQHGYSTVYTVQRCGKGLIPNNFTDFRKQRFRWAYGAVQILKHHRHVLCSSALSQLTPSQRYYFIAGWLPWISEGLNLLMTIFAIAWSLGIIASSSLAFPPALFSASFILVFFLKIIKMLHLYRDRVEVDLVDAFSAIVAGMSLYPTIAKAVIWSLMTKNLPFFRTPKNAASHGLLVAISEAREELFIMLMLWGAALGICFVQGLPSNDMRFWVAMLLVQSLPYLAALIMAFLSSRPKASAVEEPATA